MKQLLLVVACLLAAISSAQAQNYLYATGSPVYSTSLPIDQGVVNVNNGEIHLEVPIATKQQRGEFSLNERLIYDSRIWHIVQNGSSYSWQPTNVPNSNAGWVFSSGVGSGNITYTIEGGTTTTPTCGISAPATYTQYARWTWTDPNGTSHPFMDASTIKLSPGGVHCLNPGPGTPTSTSAASDGSGYQLSITNYTTPVITDVHGTSYYPQVFGHSQAKNVTDRNGNYWSQDTSGNLVDTSGQTPVLVTTNANTTDYAVLGVGGIRQHYTVTMEPISFHTNFSESGVSEASGSFNAIQKIALPNGSAYTFTYDSGTSGNYGELTSMTLPTGGVVTFTYANYLDSYNNQNRWLSSVIKDGGTTTFTPRVVSTCTSTAGCIETMTVRTPDQNETVYTFSLDSTSNVTGASWVQNISSYQGLASSGTLLRTANTSFTYSTFTDILYDQNSLTFGYGFSYSIPTSETQTVTLPDINYTTKTVTSISDYTGLPTETQSWDFYSGASSSPTTDTDLTPFPVQSGV